MTKEGLVKVLSNGNKTLADVGHSTMLNILNHVCVPKLIARLQQEMLNTKAQQVHAKMAQYLFVLVSIYPFEGVLDRHAAYVDLYLEQCCSNANVEARSYGRKSFLTWQKLAPDNAQSLFSVLEYQTQKAIIEEQDRVGAGPEQHTFQK